MTVQQRLGGWWVRHAQVLAGSIAGFLLASALLALLALLSLHASASDFIMWPALVAFTVAGWLLAVRLPRNAVGWLLLLTSFGLCYLSWSVLSSWLIQHGIAAGRWTAAVSSGLFVFIAGGLGLLLPLLFPDGRLPSQRRRWRLVLWCDLGYIFFAAFNIFDGGPLTIPTLHQKVANPLATGWLTHLTSLIPICIPMLLVGFIGSFASVFVRWRTADADRREQMKWVILALALAPIPFLLNDAAPAASNLAFTIVLPIVPTAVAVSVLRYRLYEIDRIISRAVAYLLVTGLLIGVYIGCIALADALVHVGSSFGVAAATLAAAAMFQPARRRVQQAVDHRFNRARYDAARTIDAFSVRLRDEVDPEVVCRDLMDVTTRAIEPSSISLWVAS